MHFVAIQIHPGSTTDLLDASASLIKFTDISQLSDQNSFEIHMNFTYMQDTCSKCTDYEFL